MTLLRSSDLKWLGFPMLVNRTLNDVFNLVGMNLPATEQRGIHSHKPLHR